MAVGKVIQSKVGTAVTRYRERGLKGLLFLLRQKINSIGAPFVFRNIRNSVIFHLSERERINQISKKLSEGVLYAVGMAVDGDIAEFGTMTGKSAVALAVSLDYVNEAFYSSDKAHGFAPRKLWLFDSFEGLPKARFDIDANSPLVSSGIWSKGTCVGLTPDGLTSIIVKYLRNSKLEIVKGWFKDTVPLIPSETRFALIHIDGDLYESAIDVLDNLLARSMISRGALIYF